MKRQHHTCYCSSYPFPHRMGSGQCKCWPLDRLCEACGQPAHGMTVDYGIGSYEFWGMRGVHRDVQRVSECCEAGFMDNDATTGRFFSALLKKEAKAV